MPAGSKGYGGGVSPVAQRGNVRAGWPAVFVAEGIIAGATTYVEEAPIDGQTYARQNAQWVQIDGAAGGGITSITAGTGLSGGTITTAGTIALQTPVSLANGGTGVSATSTTALLTALGAAPLNSPALTGAPRSMNAPALTDNSSQLATTAWVTAKLGGGPPPAGGGVISSPGGGAVDTPGGGAVDTPAGGVALLRQEIAALEARIAALEGTK